MRDADLSLLLDFLNAHHHDHGGVWVTDCLGSEETLRAHLHGLGGNIEVDRADRDLALRLRNALSAHIPGSYLPAPGNLDEVARELPLRVTLSESGPRLVAARTAGARHGAVPEHRAQGDDVRDYLAQVLGLAYQAMSQGLWARLKACRNQEDCQWVFLDRSKNRSRVWCSMETCGTTAKVRAYRARQRAARHPSGDGSKRVPGAK